MSKNRPGRSRPDGTSELAGLTAQPEPVLVGDQIHAANSPTNADPDSGRSELPESGTSAVRDSESAAVPKYAALERKDVRVRSDQLDELRRLATQLARRRRYRSERITENTLIRIAIDLLLARPELLEGDTEQQLRESVLGSTSSPLSES